MYYTNDEDKDQYVAEITVTIKAKVYMDAYNLKNAKARITNDFTQGDLILTGEGIKTMSLHNLRLDK